jgi:hypothetical protein
MMVSENMDSAIEAISISNRTLDGIMGSLTHREFHPVDYLKIVKVQLCCPCESKLFGTRVL